MSLSWIDAYVDGIIEHCNSRGIFEILSSLGISIYRVCCSDKVLQGNDAMYIRSYFNLEVVFIRDVSLISIKKLFWHTNWDTLYCIQK